MRNIHKLLTIVDENIETILVEYNDQGISFATEIMYSRGFFNKEETAILIEYIENNRPFYLRNKRGYFYYWTPGLIPPRKKWLKKHIKRTRKAIPLSALKTIQNIGKKFRILI